ncbi:MAG: hypothetical protein EHM64_01345 [Ignavibacteriae bacterium]|nr:MAG: hypothetical protein EHM64_01345 [Ignavibacteriota bacterium]
MSTVGKIGRGLEFIVYLIVGSIFFFLWDGKYIAIFIFSSVVFLIGVYILLFHPKTEYIRIIKPIRPDSNVPYGLLITTLGIVGVIYSIIKIKPF